MRLSQVSHCSLLRLRAANAMPCPDLLSISHAENAFRFNKDVVPLAEAAEGPNKDA